MMPPLPSSGNFSKIFFAAYLIAGLLLFTDYGLSWDEELNRIGTALPEYNFVFHGDREGLLESSEKYHGPSFELLLLSAERLFNLTDTRPIYFLRHLITFFFFWLSSVFLFLLARKIFSNDRIAIICALMYVLSPRIFGESFYNSKDLGFLSFFTISLYTLHRFLEKKNILNACLHALVTGFMIDIRITGLLVPFITAVAWLADLVTAGKMKVTFYRNVLIFIFYLALQFGFMVLFWPVLWLGPFHHLSEAYSQMSDYPWQGQMLFAGEIITNRTIPWYYLPVWIAISIPLLYSLLFVTGMFLPLVSFLKNKKLCYPKNKFHFIFLALALAPLFMVIALGSVVYDGWRHLYFVYSPFVLVAGFAVEYLYKHVFNSTALRKLFSGILTLQFLFVIYIIVSDHPHQHVYFNAPARAIFSPITKHFDADYWGLSYRKGLEDILTRDASPEIHIRVENDPGIFNLEMLTPEQRARFSVHGDIHETDYWLAEFRGRLVEPERIPLEIVSQVKNSSGVLLTTFRGLRQQTPHQVLFHEVLDFEDSTLHQNISDQESASGKFSNELSYYSEMSAPVSFLSGPVLDGEVLEIQMSAMVNSSTLNPRLVLVLSVMRNDSVVYWRNESFQNIITEKNSWIKTKWNLTFPQQVIYPGDKIVASAWNIDKTLLFVDDFSFRAVKYFPPDDSPYSLKKAGASTRP